MAINRVKLRQIILQEIRHIHEDQHELPTIAKQRNTLESTVNNLTNTLINVLRSMENVNEIYEDFPVLGTVDQLIEDLVDLVVGREDVINTEYDTFFRRMRRYAAGARVYASAEWQLMLARHLKDLVAMMIDLDSDLTSQTELTTIRETVYDAIGSETEALIQKALASQDIKADAALRKSFLDLGIID